MKKFGIKVPYLKKIIFIGLVLISSVSCITTYNTMNEILWIDLGSISYGDDPNQYIEITAPKYNNQNENIIFFIKGYGNRMIDPIFLEKYRNEFIIAKIDFRHITHASIDIGMGGLLSDVHDGILALKNNLERRGIQPNKVIIIGSSLGGTLALMYSYTFNEISPIPIAFCVSLAGITDMTDAMFLQHLGWSNNSISRSWLRNSPTLGITRISPHDFSRLGFSEYAIEELRRYSPVFYVNESSPPTIIIHDTNDKVVPFSNSASLSHILNSYGVPNIFIQSTANAGHLLGNNVINGQRLVFSPVDARLSGPIRRVTRRIHPLIEEKMITSMNQYISMFCQ